MSIDIEQKLDHEGLKLASIGKRAVALFLDDLIVSALVLIAIFDKISGDDITQTIEAINKALVLILLVKIAYQTVFIALYGATPGKMAMRLRVVSINAMDNPTWPNAIIRASVRILSEMFFYIGFAWALSNPLKQTWHDKAAKTLVLDAS